MRKDDSFFSERLYIRGINEQDTDYLVKWRSDPELIQYFRQTKPLTREEHMKWFYSYCQNINRYDFMILTRETSQAIGTVGVNHVDWEQHSCEISYMIAETAYQRKGYAIEAIALMINTMVNEEIYHFFAEIHLQNTASINTVKKLGFSVFSEHAPFVIYSSQKIPEHSKLILT